MLWGVCCQQSSQARYVSSRQISSKIHGNSLRCVSFLTQDYWQSHACDVLRERHYHVLISSGSHPELLQLATLMSLPCPGTSAYLRSRVSLLIVVYPQGDERIQNTCAMSLEMRWVVQIHRPLAPGMKEWSEIRALDLPMHMRSPSIHMFQRLRVHIIWCRSERDCGVQGREVAAGGRKGLCARGGSWSCDCTSVTIGERVLRSVVPVVTWSTRHSLLFTDRIIPRTGRETTYGGEPCGLLTGPDDLPHPICLTAGCS